MYVNDVFLKFCNVIKNIAFKYIKNIIRERLKFCVVHLKTIVNNNDGQRIAIIVLILLFNYC